MRTRASPQLAASELAATTSVSASTVASEQPRQSSAASKQPMQTPLLGQQARSDQPSVNAVVHPHTDGGVADVGRPSASDEAPLMLIVESLIPVRGHAIEISPSARVSALKAQYAEILAFEREGNLTSRGQSAVASTHSAEYELHVRLVLDGVELLDDSLLSEYSLRHGSRLVAMGHRTRTGLVPRMLRTVWRWWPLCALVVAVGLLLAEATMTRALCSVPLPGRVAMIVLTRCPAPHSLRYDAPIAS